MDKLKSVLGKLTVVAFITWILFSAIVGTLFFVLGPEFIVNQKFATHLIAYTVLFVCMLCVVEEDEEGDCFSCPNQAICSYNDDCRKIEDCPFGYRD